MADEYGGARIRVGPAFDNRWRTSTAARESVLDQRLTIDGGARINRVQITDTVITDFVISF